MNLKREISWIFIKRKLSRIKLVLLDIDGVLTNGNLLYSESGEIKKSFNVRDGLGIKLLKENGIQVALISGGSSGAAEARSKDLNIDFCFTKVKNKSAKVEMLIKKLELERCEILFVGDDINDLVVREYVELLISVNDAANILKNKSNAVLNSNGGEGAIRELAERILSGNKVWEKIKNEGWKDLN